LFLFGVDPDVAALEYGTCESTHWCWESEVIDVGTTYALADTAVAFDDGIGVG
jgi:hypothetical protein